MVAGLLTELRGTGLLGSQAGRAGGFSSETDETRNTLVQRDGDADLAAIASGIAADAGIGEGEPQRGAARRSDVGAGLDTCVEIFGARTRRLVAELGNAFNAQLRFDHVSALRQVTV